MYPFKYNLSLFSQIIGLFAFAGYYSEYTYPHLPAWPLVMIVTSPILITLFIQWNEMSDRIVMRAHLMAVIIYSLLACGMEIGAALGYKPEGMLMYRVMGHFSWSLGWGLVLRNVIRKHRELKRMDLKTER